MNRRAGRGMGGGTVEAPEERVDLGEAAGLHSRQRGAASRSPGAAPWLSRLWSGLQLVAGLALVVGISVSVAWGAHRYASTTARFGLRTLEVSGNHRLSDGAIAKIAGVAEGVNLFVLDTDRVEGALLAEPWIEQVKVTRELPTTLRIELMEREASAVAVIGERRWLVTAEGAPFKEVGAGDPHDLPHLTGVSLAQFERDRTGALERLRTGIEVLRQYARTVPSRAYPPQEVHLGDDGRVVLTAGKQGLTLHLGRGEFRRKVLMAERIVGQLQRRGRTPGILFLDNEAHPERVVARMR